MQISIIGSGAVATHLGLAFWQAGHCIDAVYSPQLFNAQQLAERLNAKAVDDILALPKNSEIYLIAVKDDAIAPIAQQLNIQNGMVLHTAGSVSMRVLAPYFEQVGVFYPLQTFSKNKAVDFKKVPLCLESSSEIVLEKMKKMASELSDMVYEISENQRKILHLSAVFACNFSNLMYAISEDILKEGEMDFDIIRPLIQETANKVMQKLPKDVQTGPAVRKDLKTIQNHSELLKNHPDILKIYDSLTAQIIEMYK